MRVVIDEDIPRDIAPRFKALGHTVEHVVDLRLKNSRTGELLAALSEVADVFVIGDTNLGQQVGRGLDEASPLP